MLLLADIGSIVRRTDYRPLAAVLLVAVLVALGLQWTGRMEYEEVFDTPSYLEFAPLPLETGLSGFRTYGYPLFVQTILAVTGTKGAVPWVQYLVHVACVLCWYWGSRNWFPTASLAALAASSLLVTNTLLRNVFILSSDGLASSLAIAAIGMLMGVVTIWWSAPRWGLLGALVFATYQVRPAYLFLVPLCPALGVGLLALRQWIDVDGERGETALSRWKLGGWLAGLAVGPLLIFCLLRWVVVGDFGLVSFSGYNFCGVAGQFLDRSMIPCLPADVQPVATEALRRREELAAEDPAFTDEIVTSYITLENRWNHSTWTIFFRAAHTVADGNFVQTNRLLVRLATSIIRCRPKLYAIWLAKAWARGVYILVSELVIHPLVLVLLPPLLLVHFVGLARRGGASDRQPRQMQLPLNALLLIAAAFSIVNIAFIIISSPPLGRFMDAAGVFWLPWFCLVLVDRWQWMRVQVDRESRRPAQTSTMEKG